MSWNGARPRIPRVFAAKAVWFLASFRIRRCPSGQPVPIRPCPRFWFVLSPLLRPPHPTPYAVHRFVMQGAGTLAACDANLPAPFRAAVNSQSRLASIAFQLDGFDGDHPRRPPRRLRLGLAPTQLRSRRPTCRGTIYRALPRRGFRLYCSAAAGRRFAFRSAIPLGARTMFLPSPRASPGAGRRAAFASPIP
jgi:hypothetical protein